MKLKLLALLILALGLARLAEAGPVIVEGNNWRYYKGRTSTPPNDGAARQWTQALYDDSTGWGGPSPTPFGYGDNDDATVFADMFDDYVSVYIRRRFQIANTGAVTRLTLGVDIDDGLVAYINGTEVLRYNVPTGAVTHLTQATIAKAASRSSNDLNSEDWFYIDLAPGLLRNGTNVLAISGHNIAADSSDFTVSAALYTNVTLLRGPIIQMPETNGMTVAWRTDALTDSFVDYGADTNYAWGTASVALLVRDHAVLLPGLPPGSDVAYRVRSGGVNLFAGSLRTPPAPDQLLRLVVIGDFGAAAQAGNTAIASRVTAELPDFITTVGDNVYDFGQPGNYDRVWFRPYGAAMARAATFPALGNHDHYLDNARWMATNFYLPRNGPVGMEEWVYSVDFGAAHLAIIDSDPIHDGDVARTDAMRQWLTNDLARTDRFWKFVVYHHPPFTSLSDHGESTNMKEQIAPVIEQFGAIGLQGHNHFYERISPMHGSVYVTSGGGGQAKYGIETQALYSAATYLVDNSYVILEMLGRKLTIRAMNSEGDEVDRAEVNYELPFRMDGARDGNWGRATNGLILHAAIRSNLLYVATQDAGEGSDHFLYVAQALGAEQAANWGKAGQVMHWDAFLADENKNGFSAWFDASEALLAAPVAHAVTPGFNNNAPYNDGALEGVLDLRAFYGTFPTQLCFAAAPYGNANGGALYAPAQVPAGNGDGNIQSTEFLCIPTRDLALDLPDAHAGPDVSTEAGMIAVLDGSGSSFPSGLPGTFTWEQTAGPAGAVDGTYSAALKYALTDNISGVVTSEFTLVVDDTRFTASDTVLVTITPLVDTDGDGLSDSEEETGQNNLLTPVDPEGQTSDPNLADTDGDGLNDDEEAIAGTSPNNSKSVLRIATTALTTNGQLGLGWPSVSGRVYAVKVATNLVGEYSIMQSNIPASPDTNSLWVDVVAPAAFYGVDVEP